MLTWKKITLLFFQTIITVKSKAGLQLLVLSMENEHRTVSMKPFTKVAIYIFIIFFQECVR